MRSTKSPNLELIGERKIKDYFREMSRLKSTSYE
jgi:hypothetical protein